MDLRHLIAAVSAVLALTACQTTPPESIVAAAGEPVVLAPIEVTSAPVPPLEVAPPADLWQRVRTQLTWQELEHDAIAVARRNFLRQTNYLPVIAERADFYLHHIVESVEARGLPIELALLPLVESSLNPFAYSSSRAAGLWQIMPATGRHLGLEQDWWYDGRRDLRDSTRVALDYLEELHAQFEGDWMLALAAYNAGKGRVARAQRKNAARGKATDYWSLPLPRETRNYVPKLLALTQIIAEPDRYGVTIPAVPNKPAFEVADTGGQLELLRAAELAGIELTTLRAYNPGQLRWATAPDMPPEILLPVGLKTLFEDGVAQLTEADRVRWNHYRIERGDSLIRIAKRFDTQVGLLKEVNGLRGSRIRAGDTLMIPNGNGWAESLALAGAAPAEPR
ncbi:MAG: transglycosylase SLT domain-containing protein, partial [Halioglobus sp.]|nr:transglycosylase SLT domain-containing protein [Halioglobus sp.]